MSAASPPAAPSRPRGRGGRRGAGRGRGGRPYGTASDKQPQPKPSEPITQIIPGKGKAIEETETDGEVCFICASPVIHTAIAPCSHKTCHICSLRMRALYKTKACAHCRVSSICLLSLDLTNIDARQSPILSYLQTRTSDLRISRILILPLWIRV